MLRFPALTGRISLLAALCAAGPALAQQPTAKPSAPAATPSPAAADPVVATVNGQPIHLSDLNLAAQSLPPELRRMSPQQLFPMLLDQQIDRKALVEEARRTGLDKDPTVQRQLAFAEDAALQNVLLSRQVGPTITEEAVRARYNQEIAGKPGAEEVHARHILVPTEEEATKIIAELKKGGDFAALAKQNSKDPGAAQGGDLGWFKRDEMVPAFADAAFAMQPGQVSDKPVKTEFGWHVIQVLEKRQGEPTTFDQARDQLRQKMIQEGVQKAVQQARADVKVEKFNLDGSPERATDTAAPPSAATSPAAPPA
ncbi:MAG: peptidylprolyl isomerase, partial [Acetobacteraceae bacterium]|nr:peptidylprolyl isomerase [Acetobacteraceae bacterium]